ncbi:helix-turn-helix domain-containing protein [Amycolatopsis sp. lyj-112]|uniref:helix-turn-helix domain-containing protein n=1 Tax=Amycolatopsis sp. lyj-112 TaxID=2789288 RepID=UPI00397B41BA
MVQPDLAASRQLRTLLKGFKDRSGLTYEQLGEVASCSKGTAENYIAKHSHRRGEGILISLLTALGVTDAERDEAQRLHRLTRSFASDPATAGWETSAAEANCTVWEMEQFTPAEATVHPAIRRDRVLADIQSTITSPPAYASRDHDALLDADVADAARGDLSAMIILRGGPSTGKTRSLFEAVQALGPGWVVIRPRSAAAVRGLATSGLLHRRRCVLWLNELQTFLGPNGTGLSLDVLRDLFVAPGNPRTNRNSQPLVIVATLWPEKLRDATTSTDHVSDNRDLLVSANQWVRWHDIPRDFSPSERDRARELAVRTGDERLRTALDNPDRIGFTQTLAGSHELLQHYLTAPNHMDQLLLDAAGEARRLGHTSPLSASLLRAIATALWREERGPASPPPGWFDTAVAHATKPLRSTQGVQALIPLDCADHHDTRTEQAAYELADYIEQYLCHARRAQPVIDAVWSALRQHCTSAGDLRSLASAAMNRGRFQHGEVLSRAAGTSGALYELARVFAERPGYEQEAEQAYREAVAAGDFYALFEGIRWLNSQSGREGDAEQLCRDAIAGGHPQGLFALARWLESQPGREVETEQTFRDAIADGDPHGPRAFASWLATQPGRGEQAEQAFRDAIVAGSPNSSRTFAEWLDDQPGRRSDTEQVYRDSIARGNRDTLFEFARWLAGQPGREVETEQAYREAITAGSPFALRAFATWIAGQPGREEETEQIYRDAITVGHGPARADFAAWLVAQPGRNRDSEQIYRDMIAEGDPEGLFALARWLQRQPGREEETEQAYRGAITTGPIYALREFAHWLARQPGREDDIEQVCRTAIIAGHPDAHCAFAGWLATQPGREKETEQVYRAAITTGHPAALDAFTAWLAGRPGREREAEQITRFGLTC